MSVTSPNQFLTEFLTKRGLSSVSAEPLFTYQMQLLEYQQLKQIVAQYQPRISISKNKHIHWAACFVMCCSEWYRREYQAHDGWSWSGIWQDFEFELNASDIREVIPLGLETYWCRPIRFYTERRNFLGSVFIEGGLPFQLISSKDNKFGDLIRKVLANYYQVDLLGISVADLINRFVAYLPTVFAEDESIELIASIVRNLMMFADKIDTQSGNALPSEQLDKLIPRWRNQFPIPLDNDTGKGLLDNWLHGAASANVSIRKFQKKLSCKHIFDLNSCDFISEISLPKKLEFSFDKTQVSSSRLELDISEGKNRRASFGSVFAQFENNRATITTRKKGGRLPRNNLNSNLYVDICDSGIRIEQSQIPNSSIPIGDVPIGLILDDGKHVLIGHSSFTTKHTAIYVLCPAGYEVDSISGTCTKVNELTISGVLFDWFSVNGDIRFSLGENHYRICTNSSTNTSGMLQISGKELTWQSKPASVYLGIPAVKMLDGSTDSTYGLTTFINNNPVNAIKEYERYGSHILTVKNKDNDTLIRRKVAVLPDDLEVYFNCDSDSASITVSTQRPIFTNLIADECTITSVKKASSRCFSIKPSDLPPAKVTLLIQANLECEPIELTLPYPGAGIYGYDADGHKLDNELTINQLLGSEIYLYSNKEYADKFKLEFLLLPQRTNAPSFSSFVYVEDKPQVVSLYSFKERIIELLSLSNSLDAKVQILISSSKSSKKYIVRRFASDISIDRMDDLISFSGTVVGDKGHFPLAMRMAEPERKPIELQAKSMGRIELDRYEISSQLKKGGPWLIIPSQNKDIDFRPTFYPNESEFDTENLTIKSLQTAIKTYHPYSNPNSISDFIQEMESDIEHPSWEYFRNLWDNFGYLPLSTFEAWKALIKNPRALTLLLFKFEMNPELVRRLDSEFPLLWELILIDDWINSKQVFKNWLSKLISDTNLIDQQINKMFERFSLVVPSFPVEVIERIKDGSQVQLFSFQQAKAIINGHWLQDLIREQSDANWPTDLQDEILRGVGSLGELKDLINIPNSWQSSVVLFPMVSAAISVGTLNFDRTFKNEIQTTFALKKLRDFDLQWFTTIFSLTVSMLATQK